MSEIQIPPGDVVAMGVLVFGFVVAGLAFAYLMFGGWRGVAAVAIGLGAIVIALAGATYLMMRLGLGPKR